MSDIDEIRQYVIEKAKEKGLRVQQLGPNQLRCGRLNFYPSSGTIYEDGCPRREENGADEFLRIAEAKAELIISTVMSQRARNRR